LHISFAAISQNDYKENTIVVSCIYRDDYFVTSVDVIYLLEALAGNRFEVEEKNRIRRNLEGFKPMTISKSKPGTEEFFRLIMELPSPRPRNIEKDVKVFEWGKLKMMLEKVFSKYVCPNHPTYPIRTSCHIHVLHQSTVPLTQNPSSPRYDRPAHGASSTPHLNPKANRGGSVELPRLPVPPIPPRPRSLKRYSPLPCARLRDAPLLPPLHTSLQNQNVSPTYSEHLLPARYNDYDDGLASGLNSYVGMRLFDYPLELDHALLKADMGFANGLRGAPATTGRHHDGFRTGSPLSCNNSPLSTTLSVSSGTSSEGAHVENQDLAATPNVPGASSQPMRNSHRQL
jgi:hypothetical protein